MSLAMETYSLDDESCPHTLTNDTTEVVLVCADGCYVDVLFPDESATYDLHGGAWVRAAWVN